MASSEEPIGLRERTRAAVRAQISDVALDLFSDRGFDAVTVDEVAAAAGISTRSFNRYFPTKEAAVVGDTAEWGRYVLQQLEVHVAQENAWNALRCSFSSLLGLSDMTGERQKRGVRVINEASSLRAHNLEKHLGWTDMLAPVIATRLAGTDVDMRSRAIVQAGIACFETALQAWSVAGEERTPDELLVVAFDSLLGVVSS